MISNALRLHFRHTRICKHSNNLKSTRSTRTNERMARQCANNFALAWDVISRARTPNAIEYDYKMIKILQTIERGFHERMYIYIYIFSSVSSAKIAWRIAGADATRGRRCCSTEGVALTLQQESMVLKRSDIWLRTMNACGDLSMQMDFEEAGILNIVYKARRGRTYTHTTLYREGWACARIHKSSIISFQNEIIVSGWWIWYTTSPRFQNSAGYCMMPDAS